MKLSTSGTQINFGAQEIFIQQLQDEIKRLSLLNQQLQIKARQQYHQLLREQQNMQVTMVETMRNNRSVNEDTSSSSNDSSSDFQAAPHTPISTSASRSTTLSELNSKNEIVNLKTKLKAAAKFISQLIQEKEHLIEMSNQLRGELNQIKCDLILLNKKKFNKILLTFLFCFKKLKKTIYPC